MCGLGWRLFSTQPEASAVSKVMQPVVAVLRVTAPWLLVEVILQCPRKRWSMFKAGEPKTTGVELKGVLRKGPWQSLFCLVPMRGQSHCGHIWVYMGIQTLQFTRETRRDIKI
jgi:hypothetical protein